MTRVAVGLDADERLYERVTPDFFKINPAFHDTSSLHDLVRAASERAPVILDIKHSDMPHTAEAMARQVAGMGAWGVTVSPFFGPDSVRPFIDVGLQVFVVAAPSSLQRFSPQWSLAQRVVWKFPHAGYVIGAQHWRECSIGSRLVLVPGVGAQGGTPVQGENVIVTVSRSVADASDPAAYLDTLVRE